MDKFYLRLLGSVSNSRGIDSSVQKTPSSFVSSYSTVSYSRPTEVSISVEGSRYSWQRGQWRKFLYHRYIQDFILVSSLFGRRQREWDQSSTCPSSTPTWLFPTSKWRPIVLSELRFFQVCGPLPWIFQTLISIFLFAVHTADTFSLFGTTESNNSELFHSACRLHH